MPLQRLLRTNSTFTVFLGSAVGYSNDNNNAYLNWSGVIRSALEQRLQEEMDRRRKDRDAIIEAMKEQDEVAAQLGRKPATGWKGVEVIRYWRERRYSSSTHR